jgi:hypothetical protein
MCVAPSNVSVVDPAAMITAIFIVQWLRGALGGLSIHQWARGVKSEGLSGVPPPGGSDLC